MRRYSVEKSHVAASFRFHSFLQWDDQKPEFFSERPRRVVLFDIRSNESLDVALHRREQYAALIAPSEAIFIPVGLSADEREAAYKKPRKLGGEGFLCPPLSVQRPDQRPGRRGGGGPQGRLRAESEPSAQQRGTSKRLCCCLIDCSLDT